MPSPCFQAVKCFNVTLRKTKVKVYEERNLDYMDLCDPKLVHQEPPLFWGFWGQCFNDYRPGVGSI